MPHCHGTSPAIVTKLVTQQSFPGREEEEYVDRLGGANEEGPSPVVTPLYKHTPPVLAWDKVDRSTRWDEGSSDGRHLPVLCVLSQSVKVITVMTVLALCSQEARTCAHVHTRVRQ